MKITCSKCNKTYSAAATLVSAQHSEPADLNGQWKTICPFCHHASYQNIVHKPISVILSEDAKGRRHFEDMFDGECVKEHLTFDTLDAFIKWWEEAVDNPPGMWYHVIHEGTEICAGAIDPNDIDIFCENFPELRSEYQE